MNFLKISQYIPRMFQTSYSGNKLINNWLDCLCVKHKFFGPSYSGFIFFLYGQSIQLLLKQIILKYLPDFNHEVIVCIVSTLNCSNNTVF